MENTSASAANSFTGVSYSWNPVDDWATLKGQNIEVHIHGQKIDQGNVDDVMADGSVLWLTQDGVKGRRIIENQPGTYIRLGNEWEPSH